MIHVLAAHSSGTTVSATLDGGAGTDSIYLTAAAAVALDNSTVFGDDLTNFEVLSLPLLLMAMTLFPRTLV